MSQRANAKMLSRALFHGFLVGAVSFTAIFAGDIYRYRHSHVGKGAVAILLLAIPVAIGISLVTGLLSYALQPRRVHAAEATDGDEE